MNPVQFAYVLKLYSLRHCDSKIKYHTYKKQFMFLVCCQFILKSISIHVSLSGSSLHICIGGQSNPYNNTRKNIENIAVSVVIRSVILSFNVFKLYIVVQGPELQWFLKVKDNLSYVLIFQHAK